MTMGLDTTYDAWHGPYSQFSRWREHLCAVAGFPPLWLMEGFYTPTLLGEVRTLNSGIIDWNGVRATDGAIFNDSARACLPIKWSRINTVSPALVVLLSHSDCDGEIAVEHLIPLAEQLEAMADFMTDDVGIIRVPDDGDREMPARGCYDGFKNATRRFAAGCRLAAAAGESVEFH